jgi:hypothetical protein
MDAMLDEKLDVEGFWAAYVGNFSPLEFMNRQYVPEIDEAVAAYVAGLPQIFGIVRRQSWRDAFGAPIQFRKEEIISALVEKLEATEAEWRPQLNQRPAPVPAPVVEDVPPPAYTPEGESFDPDAYVVDEAIVTESETPAEELPAFEETPAEEAMTAEAALEEAAAPEASHYNHTDSTENA